MIQLGKCITTFIILIFQAKENTGTDDGVQISYIVGGSLGFVVVAIIIVVGIIIYRRYRLFLIFVCVLHSFIFNFDWSLIMNLIVYPSNKTINQTLKQKHPLRIIWSHFQHKMIVLFSIFLCFKIYLWIV